MANNPGPPRNQNLKVWRSEVFDGIVLTRGTRVTHSYPRHWHEEIHFCFYTSGHGYFRHRGNAHLVSEGDFVVTPPGEVHENWVTAGSSISFRGMYLDVPFLYQAARRINGEDLPIPECREFFPRNRSFGRNFLTLHLAAERSDSRLHQETAYAEFLQPLLADGPATAPHTIRSGCERSAVKKVREYIEQNYAEAISLAHLGQITNLSPYYIHRVFCEDVGIPPHAYQTQVRINRAKWLLRKRQPLSAVAASTGFADQSHLTRHFHRLVGVTPGRFLA